VQPAVETPRALSHAFISLTELVFGPAGAAAGGEAGPADPADIGGGRSQISTLRKADVDGRCCLLTEQRMMQLEPDGALSAAQKRDGVMGAAHIQQNSDFAMLASDQTTGSGRQQPCIATDYLNRQARNRSQSLKPDSILPV
jgi:hypothetical protein